MWIVSNEDKSVASTWGAVIHLKAGEPRQVGDDLGLLCLQAGCTEVKDVKEAPVVEEAPVEEVVEEAAEEELAEEEVVEEEMEEELVEEEGAATPAAVETAADVSDALAGIDAGELGIDLEAFTDLLNTSKQVS